MSAEWALDACGLWECGHCHTIVDETHFYEDKATGLMAHEADPAKRKEARERCGWRSDYGDGPVVRCRLGGYPHTIHDPQIPGYGPFTEHGAYPPASRADTRTEAHDG